MAQEVGYFEDNVVFTDGPFVIVEATGWRIEAELKGHRCPALPDTSIFRVEEKLGMYGKTHNRKLAERVCDLLNKMVQRGDIVLNDRGWWVVKEQ